MPYLKPKEMRCTRIGHARAVRARGQVLARRTDASDEATIKAIMPLADVILVIQDSDSDGFFTNYAKELGKELIVVKDALGIGTKLAEMK